MMVSPARLAANRANALLSTGPKTSSGKKRSSRNACRHGLTSQTPVLSLGDLPYYAKLQADFVAGLQPTTAAERQTVHCLAALQWQLNTVPALTFALDRLKPHPRHAAQVLANYSLYEQRLSRSFSETIKLLKILQSRVRIAPSGFVYAFEAFKRRNPVSFRTLGRPSGASPHTPAKSFNFFFEIPCFTPPNGC